MTINNLLLYGSIARGDSTKSSDIDLLTVGNDMSNKIIINNINISYYNLSKFIEMAKDGSLFMYHLNQEAKIIYDEGNILRQIIYNEFCLKQDYNEEILFAVELLNEIISIYNMTMNFSFANSKIAWCLRTIYSGIGANKKIPIFSKKSIFNEFGADAVKLLNVKKKSTNQNNLFPKIKSQVNKIVRLHKRPNMNFRSDLIFFKEKVLSNIKNNKNYFRDNY